jgi:hypothetical protein
MLQCILKLYFQQTAASNRRWSLSRVEWVRPELVAEVKYLTWTGNNLLRQVVYQSLCEDKPAPETAAATTSAISSRRRLKCSTVAVRRNDRPGGRSAWQDRLARGACPANASGTPVRADSRPSPGNDHRRRAPPVFRSRPRPSRERTVRERVQQWDCHYNDSPISRFACP